MSAAGFDLAETARRRDGFFQRVCEFNFASCAEADSSRLPKLPDAVANAVRSSARGRRRLSDLLLAQNGISNAASFGFATPTRRLVLLERDLIERLMTRAGVAIWSDQITRIIDAPRVLALRKLLGAEAVAFALQRAPFFFRPSKTLSEILRRKPIGDEPEKIASAVETTGQTCVEFCLSSEPENLTNRFVLKFPESRAWRFDQSVSSEIKTQTWQFLHQLLVKEIIPERATWWS